MNNTEIVWLLTQIQEVYAALYEEYKPSYRKAYSIGGTYYGATEIRSSVGNQYEVAIKVADYDRYAGTSIWDAGIKIGGAFDNVKEKELHEDFLQEVGEILVKEGFELKQKTPNSSRFVSKYSSSNEEYKFLEVLLSANPMSGTNWSLHCGIRIEVLNQNGRSVGSFDKGFIDSTLSVKKIKL